jgi:UDP-N-acetylmuramyl pentapeptide phosphotransferase/UDP-N-acetylglucosamine-1-phosphate transferase
MMREFLFAVLGGVVSSALIASMLWSGRVGPVDLPNDRSLHSIAMPRSGGLGILAGVAVGWIAFMPPALWLAALCILATVSLIDDYRPLPVIVRLAIHLLAAIAVVVGITPPATGIVVTVVVVLCFVWMINIFNFMDGANGLAGGMALFGFGAYAYAAILAGHSDLAIWAACVVGASAGFLVFNFDPARIFMGDVGSVPLGFLAATFGLEGIGRGTWPLWFPILVFSPFIVDASVTLIKRAWRGEKVWQAHREHYYQRLVRSGWSHRELALWAYGLMFVVSASACVLTTLSLRLQWGLVATWGLFLTGILWAIDRRVHR